MFILLLGWIKKQRKKKGIVLKRRLYESRVINKNENFLLSMVNWRMHKGLLCSQTDESQCKATNDGVYLKFCICVHYSFL